MIKTKAKTKAAWFYLLDTFPAAAPELFVDLHDGKLDGGNYGMQVGGLRRDSSPSCAIGRVAFALGQAWPDIRNDLDGGVATVMDSSCAKRKIVEDLVSTLRQGDNPRTSPLAAKLACWTDEWIRKNYGVAL